MGFDRQSYYRGELNAILQMGDFVHGLDAMLIFSKWKGEGWNFAQECIRLSEVILLLTFYLATSSAKKSTTFTEHDHCRRNNTMSERKREIIQLATTLIRKHGYTVVSMRMLADEVGVKAASLYNHIDSKQEILSHIILGIAERFTQGMNIVKALEARPIEKIKHIIALHIDITLEATSAMEVMQNNWMYLEDESMVAYKKSRNDYEAELRKIIKAGIADGSIRAVNPELLIYSLLSTLRYLYIWYPRQKDMNAEQLKVDMATVMLRGIEQQ